MPNNDVYKTSFLSFVSVYPEAAHIRVFLYIGRLRCFSYIVDSDAIVHDEHDNVAFQMKAYKYSQPGNCSGLGRNEKKKDL